jgi:hypothetical protein
MKKISLWAKNHKWESRVLIVGIYLSLFAIGMFTGRLLEEINVNIPWFYFNTCILLTLILWTFYPAKNVSRNDRPVSYATRKLFDLSLGAVTFLMIVYAGNKHDYLFIRSEPVQASKIVHHASDSAISNNPLIKNFIAGIQKMDVTRLSQKEKFKILRKQIRAIKQDKETSKGGKTALIVLSILVAIGLLFLLGALSCSIACSSSGALAIIVAAVGTFLIIFFLVRIIKRISNPPVQKKEGT